MTIVDTLRNEIIGKLLTISDKSYLSAINRIVDTQSEKDEIVKLSEEQKLMLQMSDDDIKNGRTMKEAELNKRDLQSLFEFRASNFFSNPKPRTPISEITFTVSK